MKNKLLLIIPFLFLLASCERDFDEIADTQQRHINFIFNTDGLFTDVLSKTNDGYSLTKLMSLPTDYLLRITAYGYDLSDSLIFTKTILLDDLTRQSLKVRHLLKSEEYRFIFVADIVKSDPYVDYYETWFQLGTKRWSDFYVYSEQRHDEASLNCMASSRMIISPDNQDVEVNFKSITYNGFCVFENLEGVDRLSGYVMNTSTFNMKSGS